jgi:hypothetical protein
LMPLCVQDFATPCHVQAVGCLRASILALSRHQLCNVERASFASLLSIEVLVDVHPLQVASFSVRWMVAAALCAGGVGKCAFGVSCVPFIGGENSTKRRQSV